jgi:hypothetical protein
MENTYYAYSLVTLEEGVTLVSENLTVKPLKDDYDDICYAEMTANYDFSVEYDRTVRFFLPIVSFDGEQIEKAVMTKDGYEINSNIFICEPDMEKYGDSANYFYYYSFLDENGPRINTDDSFSLGNTVTKYVIDKSSIDSVSLLYDSGAKILYSGANLIETTEANVIIFNWENDNQGDFIFYVLGEGQIYFIFNNTPDYITEQITTWEFLTNNDFNIYEIKMILRYSNIVCIDDITKYPNTTLFLLQAYDVPLTAGNNTVELTYRFKGKVRVGITPDIYIYKILPAPKQYYEKKESSTITLNLEESKYLLSSNIEMASIGEENYQCNPGEKTMLSMEVSPYKYHISNATKVKIIFYLFILMIPIIIILKKVSYKRNQKKFIAAYETNKIKNYDADLFGLNEKDCK